MGFCANCGTELKEGARFCPQCGHENKALYNTTQTEPIQEKEKPQSIINKITSIVDVTGGAKEVTKPAVEKKLKCPRCGAEITSFTAVCPVCGYQVTKAKSSAYIEKLLKGLQETEAKRKKGLGLYTGMFFCDRTDKKMKNYIKNFPLAETPEDLLEFMLTATTYIDFSVLKSALHLIYSVYLPFGPQSLKVRTNLIWYKKFKASYEKAISYFPDSPLYKDIVNLYNRIKVQVPKLFR